MTTRASSRAVARVLTAAAVIVSVGCTDTGTPPASSAPAPDRWLGQWNGPEGTFLRLDGGGGRYTITIANLDGPLTYDGTAAGAEIRFERNGTREVIRATNGADTGMKWLADKTNCLTIRYGEGFCRE